MTLDEAKERFPPMWVVYDHPLDFPSSFIARTWYGDFATQELILSPSLQALREAVVLAGASVNLGRYRDDDPKILEVWI